MKKATASTVRFTINFIKKQIIGTKASFDKASKGSGPIYEELAEGSSAINCPPILLMSQLGLPVAKLKVSRRLAKPTLIDDND